MNEALPGGVDTPRRSYRVKLWTLFAATLCFAVGLSIGVAPHSAPAAATPDWYVALLASAAAAIVVGLGQEVAALRMRRAMRLAVDRLKPTIAIEIVWRLLLAGLLVAALGTQLAVRRGWVELPRDELPLLTGDVLTTYAFPLGILIAVSAAFGPAAGAQRRGRPLIGALAIGGGAAIVAFITVYLQTFIMYLVHLACAGVDAANEHGTNRYGLDTVEKQATFANLAKAAMAAYALAAALLADALRRRGRSKLRRIEFGCGTLLLTAPAAYCVWYNASGLPRASPDLAEAYHHAYFRLSGLVLGLMVVSVGAYRNAQTDDAPVAISRPPTLHETWFCLAFLLGATVALVVGVVRSYLNYKSAYLGATILEFAANHAGESESQLRLALALAMLAASWRAWQLRGPPKSMEISRLDPGRLAITFVTLAALLTVGVHTLAAFGLAVWMGPWYL